MVACTRRGSTIRPEVAPGDMMIACHRNLRPDVLAVALYFLAALPLHAVAVTATASLFPAAGFSAWLTLAAYLVGAPLVGYFFLRGSRRARFAAYVFLALDVLRSARLMAWLPVALDVAIILYLQTPAMRRLYPSMWSRRSTLWRRQARD